jgi:26S proteasome regulatory subunit N7
VSLTVISGTLTLNRVDLKKKVRILSNSGLRGWRLIEVHQIISAPEVISALPELPTLADTTKNLYDCHYDKFFVALGGP